MKKGKKLKLNKKRLIICAAAAVAAIVAIMLLVSLFKLIFSNKEVSYGNDANMGLAIIDGGVTFYNKYDQGIVKVKGGKEMQITNDSTTSMYFANNKIYYITPSATGSSLIKSVETNGDNPEDITTITTVVNKIYVDKNSIYYAASGDHYGIDVYNMESKTVTTLVNTNVQDFVYSKGLVYYTDSLNHLYSVDAKTKEVKAISEEYKISKIQIMNKFAYYYDAEENALCKIKLSNGDKKVVATFVNNEAYNVTNKAIYYFDMNNRQICKADLKGKRSEAIVKLETARTRINVANGNVYYLDDSKDASQIYQMFRVKTNGKAATEIIY